MLDVRSKACLPVRHDSMTNTTYLAVLHFFRRTFLRWFAMSELLEVGILWCEFGLLALPPLLVYFLHPVVKLLARIVGGPFGLLFPGSFRSVDFCRKIWLQGCGCRLVIALPVGNGAHQRQHDQYGYPFHGTAKIRKGEKSNY